MATAQELNLFLASIEKKAFKQAVYAVRDDAAALDVVQDAMISLTEKYGDRPASELPLIFTRILQNRIHDWFRRQKVRNAYETPFSSFTSNPDGDGEFDPLELLEISEEAQIPQDGASQLAQSQLLEILEAEISKLPIRQREAFLMRYWDELSTAETALAMGCSEGSVKTHCSRATHTLAAALKARGIVL
ncbi:RpoE DNA-directed RNA polymerase specialized sigma subunit, sigma24 homolog [Burkholderiaceae bacterium]|jgi:RNA polymerase sigma-70 factor (ECF subfamily)